SRRTLPMTNNTVLGGVDPEIAERLVTRRDAIRQGAASSSRVATGLAMASIPVALAALATDAFAQGTLPQNIVDILNFALKLEYLESSFYNAGVGTSGLIPSTDLAVFQQIQKHENEHVAF